MCGLVYEAYDANYRLDNITAGNFGFISSAWKEIGRRERYLQPS